MAIQKIVTDDALSAFASDVKAAIANVSSPLVYKGTLGTGGTISTLPAASASNNGFAYVVITAGTYQGVVCAVGDVIASNGTAWNIIPQANSAETLPITTGSAVNTKEYIDDKTTLVKSASGDLITITDGGDNIQLKSCEVTINPDLSGKTECNLVVCGKNFFEFGNQTIESRTYIELQFTTPLPSGTYTISSLINTTFSEHIVHARFRKADKSHIVTAVLPTNTGSRSSVSFTLKEPAYYIFLYATAGISYADCTWVDTQIELGNTATTFEAYNGTVYNIPFGQTVYGGEGDVTTGEFVSSWVAVDLGTINYNYNAGDTNFYSRTTLSNVKYNGSYGIALCQNYFINNVPGASMSDGGFKIQGDRIYIKDTRYTDENAFKAALSGVILIYETTSPTTLSLTPVTPKTISGINNIYNDCGSTEIEYFTSSADGLAALIEVLSNS